MVTDLVNLLNLIEAEYESDSDHAKFYSGKRKTKVIGKKLDNDEDREDLDFNLNEQFDDDDEGQELFDNVFIIHFHF